MMKAYEAPALHVLPVQTEDMIMTSTEEAFDIGVEFKDLWPEL